MAKASNGAGSIFPVKNRDGKVTGYRVEMSLGFKPNGKRARTRRVVKTLREARDLRTRLASDLLDGRLSTVQADTVASYGLRWVREVKALQVRPTTAADYEDRLRRWILPSLGHIRLIDLRPQQIEAWMAELRQRGLSAATVNGSRQILNALCKHAARTGVLSSNPVLATDPVKRQSTDPTQVRQHWGLDEMWKVLEAARNDELDTFLHLLIHTGMRPGEALGLRWQDIDLDGRLVHISGTLKESRTLNSDGSGVVRLLRNSTKTEASHRTLAISEALAESLIRQQMRQSIQQAASVERWTNSGFVVTTVVGTPCSLSNVRKMFRKFVAEIDVRYIRLHDIRHSVATASLNEGRMPIEQTSQALGHSRIDTTKRIYAKNVPRYNLEFIEGMSRILPPSPNRDAGQPSRDWASTAVKSEPALKQPESFPSTDIHTTKR